MREIGKIECSCGGKAIETAPYDYDYLGWEKENPNAKWDGWKLEKWNDDTMLPMAVVTPDGVWHQGTESLVDWRAPLDPTWWEQVCKMAAQYRGCDLILINCHI